MSSKIEQLIDEIEEYIDSCKYQALSNSKIIVNKEEIDELLRELRMKTPDEIKRYQKIISNKEAILQDAKDKAAELINEATVHTNELINEHEPEPDMPVTTTNFPRGISTVTSLRLLTFALRTMMFPSSAIQIGFRPDTEIPSLQKY